MQYANEYAWMQSADGEVGVIVLLRLAAPVGLAPASIAKASPAAGATLRALGWGATSAGTDTSPPVYATRLQRRSPTGIVSRIAPGPARPWDRKLWTSVATLRS